MNVIMLDMDGVINSDDFITEWQRANGSGVQSMKEFERTYCIHDGHTGYVVPELVERFRAMCDCTGCSIVWSSSWRENYWRKDADTGEYCFDWHEIGSLWKSKGLPLERLVGCTPCLDLSRFSYVPRGCEIQRWIDENHGRYNIGKVAILDDNPDAYVGVEYADACFFQTDFEHGLTVGIADEVMEYLKE